MPRARSTSVAVRARSVRPGRPAPAGAAAAAPQAATAAPSSSSPRAGASLGARVPAPAAAGSPTRGLGGGDTVLASTAPSLRARRSAALPALSPPRGGAAADAQQEVQQQQHGPGSPSGSLSPLGRFAGGAAAAGHAPAAPAAAAPGRWRSWWVRSAAGMLMLATFAAILLWARQPGVVVLVFAMQSLIYRELVVIALVAAKERDMPGFSWFYGYWFAVCAYFMYTKTLQVHLVAALAGAAASSVAAGGTPMVDPDDPGYLLDAAEGGDGGWGAAAAMGGVGAVATGGGAPQMLVRAAARVASLAVTHYVPIAFVLYMIGFVAFVFSLRRRRNLRYQFAQFAYCHMALAVVVGQSTFLVANAYQGLLWFALPTALVIVNDSAAYATGFFCGRTPLIRISPKKTVEGFVGGAAATLLVAVAATGALLALPAATSGTRALMLCPVERGLGSAVHWCDTTGGLYRASPLAELLPLAWAAALPPALAALRVAPLQLHSVALAAFASAVAPFGGFFASGFKRAFRIKDFSHVIPGHGGVTDRMDCQIVMGAFSYVYAHYLLKLGLGFHGGESDVSAMFSRIVAAAQPADVVRLYEMLGCFIHQMGYVDGTGSAGAAGAALARQLARSAATACAAVATGGVAT